MTMRPDDHRRKWDKNEYEKLAAERLLNQVAPKEEEPVQRENLKRRDYRIIIRD